MSQPLNPPPLQHMPYAQVRVANTDVEHLKLLSIFHFIGGGLTLLFGCVFIIHIAMGIVALNDGFGAPPAATPAGTAPANSNAPPEWFGWLFIGIGSTMMLLGWTLGSLTIYSGFCLRKRRRRVFSMVVAGINCIHFPLGTLLGVFTIIVLVRESVKALYQSEAEARHGGP